MQKPAIELPEYVRADIAPQVKVALEEDVGSGDITALLIPGDAHARASIITRENATICGIPWVDEVFQQLPGETTIEWHVSDGEQVSPGTLLCEIKGNSRTILTGERTALNFLQLLSGTATQARQYVTIARERNITILDTRKTIPGLRTAQKYAVRCAGAGNHRIGLFDQFLIKENHIAAAGGIIEAVHRARELAPDRKLTIEVESLEELVQAISASPDRIMLDDFSNDDTTRALETIPESIEVEISGSQDLDSLAGLQFSRQVFVSVGALTKHVRAVDLSLRLKA